MTIYLNNINKTILKPHYQVIPAQKPPHFVYVSPMFVFTFKNKG